MTRTVMRVIQDGVAVATVDGDDAARVAQQAMHYAAVYAQDAPAVVQRRRDDGKSYKTLCIVASRGGVSP